MLLEDVRGGEGEERGETDHAQNQPVVFSAVGGAGGVFFFFFLPETQER